MEHMEKKDIEAAAAAAAAAAARPGLRDVRAKGRSEPSAHSAPQPDHSVPQPAQPA
jgi:hypothetical protein